MEGWGIPRRQHDFYHRRQHRNYEEAYRNYYDQYLRSYLSILIILFTLGLFTCCPFIILQIFTTERRCQKDHK